MSTLYPVLGTVIVVVAAIRLVATIGFYVLAAYIVRATGETAGIADIGRAVGAVIAAPHRPPSMTRSSASHRDESNTQKRIY
ncbi:hypothetical protein QYF68_00795 [Mycolicibacterium austroafricanum]|uniref:Uncharacterized protein n=1 Tax=Mycolicibacterium austroafricanum TaxID=39687 RepID=A0ABT8H747_MYCAO|nr:hypothetical protein [Mycolicibacterium austroafricanum]MDN4516365.1 hypothetical protein [Mycolicibacterium austroafricanum]